MVGVERHLGFTAPGGSIGYRHGNMVDPGDGRYGRGREGRGRSSAIVSERGGDVW